MPGKYFKIAILIFVALKLVSPAQQSADPTAILQNIRQRLLMDLSRMPRYTCTQTITRTYFKRPSHHAACSALIAAHDVRQHKLLPQAWDRLRLNVAFTESGSMYSWVGAPKFTDERLDQLAGQGPTSSGDFWGFLSEALRRTTLVFEREQVLDGRRLLEYSYDMPINITTFKVRTSKGWVLTAYSGTVVLDPEDGDIVRLSVRTAELPPESTACQGISEITYGRTPIHERMVLVPRETRLSTIQVSGQESLSTTRYSNCREYASKVRLIFDGATDTVPKSASSNSNKDAPDSINSGVATKAQSSAEQPSALPAGLRFAARIITPIDSDTSAAGDSIEAVLRSPIRGKDKTVIAPVGAHIHGRLQNVKWSSEPTDNYQITVEFNSIEIGGKDVPLSAVKYPSQPAAEETPAISYSMMLPGELAPRSLDPIMLVRPDTPSLGGTFFYREDHVRRKQLDAEWITVTPDIGTDRK